MTEPQPETEAQKKQKRLMPQSELDLALLTTDNVWGKQEVSQSMRDVLSKHVEVRDASGEIVDEGDMSAWELLAFYTRDIRLANLNTGNGELEYVQYYLDLAGDMLQTGMHDSFLKALRCAVTILESSQSKKGFLRSKMNTFTQEHIMGEMEPPKKSLFGMNKKTSGEQR